MSTVDTKSRILDVAQVLIQSRGLNAMSYKDLSDVVGIRKASIHHHFPSKQDMLHALLERYIAEFEIAVNNARSGHNTAREEIESYFHLYTTPLQDKSQDKVCLCGILSAEIVSLDDTNNALLLRFFSTQKKHLVEILKRGISDGSLNIQGGTAAKADLIISSLEGALLMARNDGGIRRMRAILKELLNLM